MKPGDRVEWIYAVPGKGEVRVLGVLVRLSRGRATITVTNEVAGEMRQENRSVSRSDIFPCAVHRLEIGESGGIKTTAELNARLVAGRNTPFDYDRLIDEAKSYV